MVLVCNKPEFIYLKTRKTAGTSIEMALEPLCVPPGTEIVEHRKASFTEYGIVGRRGYQYKLTGWKKPLRYFEWRNHQSASFVYKRVGKEKWDRSPKISTVRNPFDRTVSYFHFMNRKRIDPNWDFARLKEEFRNVILAGNWRDDTKIVFLKGEYIIDHMIRFEHMGEDLRKVVKELSLPLDDAALPVTKSMASVRKKHDVPDYYDPDTIDIVKKKLSWIFERFDYPEHPIPKFSTTPPENEPAK